MVSYKRAWASSDEFTCSLDHLSVRGRSRDRGVRLDRSCGHLQRGLAPCAPETLAGFTPPTACRAASTSRPWLR